MEAIDNYYLYYRSLTRDLRLDDATLRAFEPRLAGAAKYRYAPVTYG